MTLDILICTFNGSIASAEAILLPPRDSVRYKISQQYTDERYAVIPESLAAREDVSVSFIEGRGLSRNRNNVLSMADADICLIADDDVRYTDEYIDTILTLHSEYPDAQVITGQIETRRGEPRYKNYREDPHSVEWKDIRYISSVEISFKRKTVAGNNITFDERFGLGSIKYDKGGEENAFIADCKAAGLKVQYIPRPFVTHTYQSTGRGRKNGFSREEIEFRAAYAARVFGRHGVVKNYIRCIAEYPKYRKEIGVIDYFKAVRKGNECKRPYNKTVK